MDQKLRGLPLLTVAVCTSLATLMQALDSTIANVALPYMQGTMSASQSEINWVLTSYIVATAIMTAPVGFLASRFGRTRLFVVSIIGFTITSMMCGAAQSLQQIVLFRILQGMCSAALVPLSQAVLYEVFPPEKRGSAMALWGLGVQVGPAVGPIVGGWLTEHYSWRWVFYVNVPFGILAAIGIALFLRESPRQESRRLDWIGFGSLGIAIACLQLVLDRGQEKGWLASPEIVTEACFAGLGFYIFLVQSALAKHPFLSPKLLKDVNFVVGTLFIFVIGVVLFASLALLAPYLQVMMGYPVVTAGLVLAPRGFGTMVTMIIVGRLVGRYVSVRALVGAGFILSSLTQYLVIHWTPDVSQTEIVLVGLAQGMAIGMIFVPLSTIVFASLPLELRTEATGVYSLMRNIGSAAGISITGAVLQSGIQVNHEIIAAPITPFNHALQSGAAGLFWNPATSAGAMALNGEITRQATIISYDNDFILILAMNVLAIPLVLLLREAPRHRRAGAVSPTRA